MLNPFYIYILSTLLAFFLFSFKWSTYYNQLSIELYIFFIVNMIISLIIGLTMKKRLIFKQIYDKPSYPKIILFLLYFGFFVDFLYSKELPILNILLGIGSFYKEIEHIPSFYPFLTSLDIFYFIYFSSVYINTKEKKYFYISLLLLLPLIANMGRGLLIMATIPVLLIFIAQKRKKISIKIIMKSFVFLIISFTIFGYLGDIKSASVVEKRSQSISTNDLILFIGGASNEFKDSHIPNSFFWVYLYSVSPIANLNNIIKYEDKNNDFYVFVIYNFMPQSLQKIFLGEFKKDKSNLVVDTFNVSTMYALPFMQLGWLGIITFQIILYLFFFVLYWILYDSKYKIIFLSIFSTIMLLSNFANILVLDVIYIPLVLCVLFALQNKLKKRKVQ